jgi:transcriptional regulator with XRE-family HTH domain
MHARRLGAALRAVRIRHGWRQVDLARRSGISDSTVSRVEHGRLDDVSLSSLARLADALDVRLDIVPRWRGGELDRMLNAGHARLHELASRLLADAGWTAAPEVSFSVYGERGVIDILAFHAATGSLLVVELKTDIVDVQELIGAVDRYRRLARGIASERGWTARSVSAWVLLRDSDANHRRLARHAAVLRSAFPDDGRRMRAWLRRPAGAVAALSFLAGSHSMGGSAASSGVQRVRPRRPGAGTGTDDR